MFLSGTVTDGISIPGYFLAGLRGGDTGGTIHQRRTRRRSSLLPTALEGRPKVIGAARRRAAHSFNSHLNAAYQVVRALYRWPCSKDAGHIEDLRSCR